jgi:hypothetical protein
MSKPPTGGFGGGMDFCHPVPFDICDGRPSGRPFSLGVGLPQSDTNEALQFRPGGLF